MNTPADLGEVTAALSNFAITTDYEDLPEEVVTRAKLYILDQLGVQLRLHSLPTCRRVAEYARSGPMGPSTVVGHGFRTMPEFAAFANAVAGHALELDDMHLPSLSHPGCVVVPPAIAVGESQTASGSQVITSVALGYEVMCRIGHGLGQEYVYGRGFHPVGVLGPIGAAVTSAKLLNVKASAMFHAIGIATSQGAGTLEYNQTWGESARLHAGFASMAGIRSAILALSGITGPGSPIEGKYGFARVHSDEYNFATMTNGLGSTYLLLENAFKVRPYHGMVHNAVDVCLEALSRSGRAMHEADIDSIEQITIGLSGAGVRGILEGSVPARFDDGLTALNFSLEVPVAHAILTHGATDAVIGFDRVTDPVRQLAKKVRGEFSQKCDDEYRAGRLLATVEIIFDDRQVVRCANYRKGSKENPITLKEVRDKFLALATHALGPGKAEEVLGKVSSLEDESDIRELGELVFVAARNGAL